MQPHRQGGTGRLGGCTHFAPFHKAGGQIGPEFHHPAHGGDTRRPDSDHSPRARPAAGGRPARACEAEAAAYAEAAPPQEGRGTGAGAEGGGEGGIQARRPGCLQTDGTAGTGQRPLAPNKEQPVAGPCTPGVH
eukprot:365069-Chlamydomonas_euryale.AAC.30